MPELTEMTGAQRLERQREVLSPLLRAQQRSVRGEKVNACPFRCRDEDLDDHGYCRHLVGFADAPLDARGDLRRGACYDPMVPDLKTDANPWGTGQRKVLGGRPERVLASDKLVRITTTYRVYRDVGPAPAAGAGDETLDEPTKPRAATA